MRLETRPILSKHAPPPDPSSIGVAWGNKGRRTFLAVPPLRGLESVTKTLLSILSTINLCDGANV